MKTNNFLLLILLAVLSADLHAGVRLEYDHKGFVEACLESGNLSRAVCECTSRKASRELTPAGFEFLVATLRKEKDKTLELRRKLEQKEVVAAGKFMSHGPDMCARELGEKPAR